MISLDRMLTKTLLKILNQYAFKKNKTNTKRKEKLKKES